MEDPELLAPAAATPSERWLSPRLPPIPWHSRLSDSEYVERLRREEQRSWKRRCVIGGFVGLVGVAYIVLIVQLFRLLANVVQLGGPAPGAVAGLKLGFCLGFIATGIFAGGLMHLIQLLVHLFPDRQRRLLVKYHDAFHVARRHLDETPTAPSGEPA